MQLDPVFCEARRCLALDTRKKRWIGRCESVVQVFDAQRYIQVKQLATEGNPSQSDGIYRQALMRSALCRQRAEATLFFPIGQ